MKTDERMADRIAHLEKDIKILKNEVQAVLIDLKEKYLAADSPLNATYGTIASHEMILLETDKGKQVKSETDSQSESVDKKSSDRKEEPKAEAEPVKGKSQEPVSSSETAKDRKEEPKAEAEPVKDKSQEPVSSSETAKDRKEEPIPVPDKGTGLNLDAAHEEVKKAHITEELPGNIRPKYIPGHEINLISIGGLVNWVEESVKKLGVQRTEAILDVAEMMGFLSPQLKQIMLKLMNTDNDGNAQSVSARIFLDSLVKITTLLGKDNKTEAALLSILSREDEPWIK